MSEPDARVEMAVLVIDDDPAVLRSIAHFLADRGHRVSQAQSGPAGLEILERDPIDMVITDVKMPGMDGFEVLREVRRISPGTEVIMVTAFGDIENAVRAMREGAFDFFPKPIKMQDLHAALQRTVRFQALRREKDRYRERLDRLGTEARQRYGLSAITGKSPTIQKVRDLIEQVCQTDATSVLVCGETGTGKELVARAIHYESVRTGGPFVAVDCSAIPDSLVESEFYGHVKGAFTDARQHRQGHFVQADGGTLFLDEIGDMDMAAQAKLLRTLEERRIRPVGGSKEIPVDVRVVSATNRDLPEAVSRGAFREDLYYRLNAFTIQIPALRERPEDILPLAEHFLQRYVREMRKPVGEFTPEAASLLEAHPFPGNVRELRNLVERAVILSQTDRVTPDNLEFDRSLHHTYLQHLISKVQTPDLNLAAIEKAVIRQALLRCGGNQVHAAELLGISRDALRRRMALYGLMNPE